MIEPSPLPFPFIVGSGRCGSTLLRVMFDSHPQMAVPIEVYFPIPAPAGWFDANGALLVEVAAADLESRPWYPKMRLDLGALGTAARSGGVVDYPSLVRSLYGTYAHAQGKPRYGNKSPMHVTRLPELADMFGEARFIHIVRDGRNVALSYLQNNFGPSDLSSAAKAWQARVTRGRRAGQVLGPDRYRELRYEDLIDDPEGELRRLCDFVELAYDDSMLRYYERIPTMVISDGKHQKLSMPPTKGMRDWRRDMEPWQVALFESIAAPALEAFGYELSHINPSASDRIRIGVVKARSEVPRSLRRALRKPARALRRRKIAMAQGRRDA